MAPGMPSIVIAPDSFKGSRSAVEVSAAMAAGVRLVLGANAEVILRPLADGGEGTLDTMLSARVADLRTVEAHDAIGRPRTARYGIFRNANVAIIEAAEGAGLTQLADVGLDPMHANSIGVGEIVASALADGVDEILLCVGGSASTDGGTGLLRALGACFLDDSGKQVVSGGAGLRAISTIDIARMDERARRVRWRVACDVDNRLTGEEGAAKIFGPQKGASPAQVAELEAGLTRLSQVLRAQTGVDVSNVPGAGAAGGMPACLLALFDAELVAGIDLVADAVALTPALARADLALTGEGCFDSQSLRGKVVHGVLRRAPETCPVVVVAGVVKLSPAETRAAGFAGAFSIANGPTELRTLFTDTDVLVRDTVAHITSVAARSGGWLPRTGGDQGNPNSTGAVTRPQIGLCGPSGPTPHGGVQSCEGR